MHKPFAVQRLRHLFQDSDTARVVLDQVVIGREDGGNFALRGKWR